VQPRLRGDHAGARVRGDRQHRLDVRHDREPAAEPGRLQHRQGGAAPPDQEPRRGVGRPRGQGQRRRPHLRRHRARPLRPPRPVAVPGVDGRDPDAAAGAARGGRRRRALPGKRCGQPDHRGVLHADGGYTLP
jgi:hypothetical protein